MANNYYAQCLQTEINLCLPIINQERINRILFSVNTMVGDGARPQLILDLEQLQVADYRAFDRISDQQRAYIKQLHSHAPIRPEEMVYLALRSMFAFTWPMPESEDDIRRAAAYEYALNAVLTNSALDVSASLKTPDALLPYWVRLSFLRIMIGLPAEKVAQYHLDKVACILIKRPEFNATTFALEQGPLIGLNFSLEPILKNLNRYLLHYFHTQNMAGPTRLGRAWESIIPTILHFWNNVSANKLTNTSAILFDIEMQKRAKAMTDDQIDFVLMHEIGHVALDHPKRLHDIGADTKDITPIRHEFEFGADDFAFELLRSRLLNEFRYFLNPKNKQRKGKEKNAPGLNALLEYERSYEAAYILYVYMDFIDRAGRLLISRLGERIKFRSQIDSHPQARARLTRLQVAHLGDIPHTTDLIRYAEEFFDYVLEYASKLQDQALFDGLQAST
jgi:hypothetical protein